MEVVYALILRNQASFIWLIHALIMEIALAHKRLDLREATERVLNRTAEGLFTLKGLIIEGIQLEDIPSLGTAVQSLTDKL